MPSDITVEPPIPDRFRLKIYERVTLMALKDFIPINTELAGNPLNWVVVTLMVMIAGLAISLVFHNPFGKNPISGDN